MSGNLKTFRIALVMFFILIGGEHCLGANSQGKC